MLIARGSISEGNLHTYHDTLIRNLNQNDETFVPLNPTEITALNARVEQMMAQTAASTATSLGRTIDVIKVPLLDQPIVDAAGKSNLKELTKPGRTRDLLNKIAGVLGVKTYGAGYSIETTRPKRLNQGDIVPGTGNQDTVPAMLTPGEFIVNKKATEKNLPLLQAINQNKEAGFQNSNGGWLKADTLSGVKSLINRELNPIKNDESRKEINAIAKNIVDMLFENLSCAW